jgi:hypothetical protein
MNKNNYPWLTKEDDIRPFNTLDKRRRYMEWLGNQLGYTQISDWYRVTQNDFKKNRGISLLKYYKKTTILLLRDLIHQVEWYEWMFEHHVPHGFWEKEDNHIRYLKWLEQKLNYNNPEDWYKINGKILKESYGNKFLDANNGLIINSIIKYLPKYNLVEWKFDINVPTNFWNDINNQRRYMDWLLETLNYTKVKDLYKLTPDNLKNNYGSGLLSKYNNTLIKLVIAIYDEFTLYEWKFKCGVYNHFWDNIENQKRYMNWLYKKIKYKSMEDWHNLTLDIVRKNYGKTFISQHYGNSIINLLKKIHPEYNWKEWLFLLSPEGFWNDINNQKRYIEWFKVKMNIQTIEEWYNIKLEDFLNNKGYMLIEYYNNSYSNVIKSFFPNYKWVEWKFTQPPNNFWKDINNQKCYMDWLYEELEFTKVEDWYKVTKEILYANCGDGLLCHYYNSSPTKMIKTILSEYKWTYTKFIGRQNSYKSTKWLKYIENKNNIVIQHAENGGEFKIPNTKYKADGYCKENNTIYEFNGCLYHGCTKCFRHIL